MADRLDQKKTGIQNILNRQSEHLSFYPAMIDQSPDVLKLLLQEGYIRGINIRAILASNGHNILQQAARNENINMIKLLLEYLNDSQVNTNGTNAREDYSSVFRYATRNKNPEVIEQLFDNKTALGIKTTQELNYIHHQSLDLAVICNNIEIVKFLLDHAKNLDIDVSQLLKSKDNAIILHNILKSPNSKMLDLLLKTLAELENGNEAISTLIHKHLSKLLSSSHINETTMIELENGKEVISTIINKPLSSSHTKEKLVLALSYIKSEDQKSFIAHCTDILESDQFTVLDEMFVSRSIQMEDGHHIFANKEFVTHPMKIEDDSVKNAIISSAYKISVLRDQVGDSLFSKEGNVDNKWLKSGELTKLSLVKKDLMEYIEPKENNSNSLNGETKKTDWNNLKTNLKAKVLSFLIAPKEETPESIKAVFTVLRQPLHKALEEQEIKAEIALKKGMVTNTSNNLASEEVTMLEMYEEQSENAKDDTDTNNLISLNVPALDAPYEQSEQLKEPISLRKAKHEKAGATPDKEPPTPAPALNKYLINKELGIMEVSNGLKPKILALPDASQEQNVYAVNFKEEFAEQNTAYVPSSIQKALSNASIGFKMLDSAVDSARFIHEPTANNATKVIVDSAHLYSMLAGFNLYSATISAAEIIYLGSIGEYGKVLQHAVMTAAYMGLPYAAMYAPQLALVYSAVTAGCSAYNALSNLYSLYKESSQSDWSLKSYAAYADLGWFWHNTLDWLDNDLDVELAAYAEMDWQNDLYQSDNDLHIEL